ncbi:hypothetical protein LPB260_20730 [Pseudomonas sp. LPB0260]|uniref:hypothetical protein n=1 Tax=Pseudomonas sp. LPB0260 TaxID=2614442 RepID=UPI0015C271E3|nr:hypothetical protein [Pseudomonas sp. LPB0260]QLC73178.1 hypothetical protein LPB260_05780 [Pseudomonas sp. LPB0260]QLC75952.1 hypothetical protein LPB260_20730 [Pseudomonas sp. LPB0260]
MSHSRRSALGSLLDKLAACGLAALLTACAVAEPAPQLSTEAQRLAHKWQAMRAKPGHFTGGAWDDQVDKWQGAKHQLMQQLLDLAWTERYDASQLRTLFGAPDRVLAPAAAEYADGLRQTNWQGQPSGELWAYEWRGQHDQLLFAVDGEEVRAAGWWLLYE